MRKKILTAIFSLVAVTSYSFQYQGDNVSTINSNFVTEKGKDYMRKGVLSSYLYRSGSTSSTQKIELYSGTGENEGSQDYLPYDTKSKGFLIGTTSQFNATHNTAWMTGVSFGYIYSNLDFNEGVRDENIHTIGVNAYISYLRNTNVYMAYLGTGLSSVKNGLDNTDKNDVKVGIEAGRVYDFGNRNYFYPYIGIEGSRYFMDDYYSKNSGINDIAYYRQSKRGLVKLIIGTNYTIDRAKYFIEGNLKATQNIIGENPEYSVKLNEIKMNLEELNTGKLTGIAEVKLGYYWAEDLLYTLEVSYHKNKNYKDLITGVRVSYSF